MSGPLTFNITRLMSVMLTGSVGACSVVFAMIAGAYSYAAKHQWSSGDLYEGQSALQGQ